VDRVGMGILGFLWGFGVLVVLKVTNVSRVTKGKKKQTSRPLLTLP
jgi:hypothetical protein